MHIAFLIPLAIALMAGLLPLLLLLHSGLRRGLARHRFAAASIGLPALWLGYYSGFGRMLPLWWQPLPPVDSTRWLPFLLPLFALPALAAGRPWLRGLGLYLLGALYAWLVLAPLQAQNQAPLWLLALFGALPAALALLEPRPGQDFERPPSSDWLQPALIASLAAASGALFILGSTAQMAFQAMMLALVQLPAWLAARLLKTPPPAALRDSASLLLAGLWLNAGLYASVGPWQAWLLLLLALPALERRLPARWPPWQRAALCLLLALIALGATLTAVWLLQPQDVYWG